MAGASIIGGWVLALVLAWPQAESVARAERLLAQAEQLLAADQAVEAGERIRSARALVQGEGLTHRDRMRFHGELGLVYQGHGYYREARTAYEAGLVLAEQPGYERFATRFRYQLALMDRRLGRLELARERLERIVQTEGADTETRARASNELGLVVGELGQPESRRPCFELAFELASEADTRQIQAEALTNLVYDATLLGDHAGARELQHQALEFAREHGLADSVAAGEGNLAYLDFVAGEHEQALETATRALPTLEELGFEIPLLELLDTMARAALAIGDLARTDEALARANALLERGALAGLAPDELSAWRARYSGWSRIEQDRVSLGIASSPDEREALIAHGLERSGRWKGRALERSFAARSPAWSESADIVAALREHVLADTSALVEYAEGGSSLHAYVLTGRSLARVDLGDRAEIERLAATFLERIADRRSSVGSVGRSGHALFTRILAPVLAVAGPREELFVLPTPALAAVPFEALVVSQPGNRPERFDELEFLIDRCTVLYGPSHDVLLHLARVARAAVPSGPVLILADPHYPPGSRFAPLPNTREEAHALARHVLGRDEEASGEDWRRLGRLMDEDDGSLELPSLALHVGRAASPARLRGASRPYSVVHVAAHGEVDLDAPRSTGFALSPTDVEDGFVGLDALLALELESELTVLAACSSARGWARHGEGVLSLAWGFLHAGSRSVVATLWQIPDLQASQVMRLFFEHHVREGVPPAEALRQAKLAVRRTTGRGITIAGRAADDAGHPFYWAPYVYVGPR